MNILEKLEETVISLLLFFLTLLVFFEVFLRFAAGTGLIWIQELTLHTAAWFILLGASYGIKTGAHIQVDILVNALGEKARKIAGYIALGSTLLYCILFFYGSWIYLSKLRRIGIELEDFAFPKWIAHSALLIGMLLIAFRIIQLFWQSYKGEICGFQEHNEADEILEEYQSSNTSDSAKG